MKTFGKGQVINNRDAQRTCQVKVRKGAIVDGHMAGTTFWTTPGKAQAFSKGKAVDIIGGTVEGAAAQEADLGKSSDARSTGPSTDSASSTPNGPDAPLSVSGADPASNMAIVKPSPPHTFQEDASGSLLSITHTSGSPEQTSSTSQTPAGGNGTGRIRSSRRSRG